MALLLIACLSLQGCLTINNLKPWWKKEHAPEKAQPGAVEERSIDLSNEDYYKQHYTFWRGWQEELSRELGGNRKRVINTILEIERHLTAMSNYLIEEEAQPLRMMIQRFREITAPIKKGDLNSIEIERTRRRLEIFGLEAQKNFAPSKVKGVLLPTPPPVDMTEYEGEEVDLQDEEGV